MCVCVWCVQLVVYTKLVVGCTSVSSGCVMGREFEKDCIVKKSTSFSFSYLRTEHRYTIIGLLAVAEGGLGSA